MDILISLLYTGVQDGWVTVNGRGPENKDGTALLRGRVVVVVGRRL